MMALREIAKVHIAKCKDGDMQAIKELADRLDGKPAQILDLNDPDSNPIRKIVHEFVHVTQTPEELAAENEPVPIEGRGCEMRMEAGRMEAAVSMRRPRARNASFDHARRYAVIAGQLFRISRSFNARSP
jgi:hypothetical protein